MLVEKIVKITGVARFLSLAAAGDVALKRLTLIYGDNGSGKTSLAAVLRSMMTGDGQFINERATLGSDSAPEVEIRLSKRNAKFTGGGWNETLSTLEIFDSNFVNENVYAGDHVALHHRKNLYEVVVGAKAVEIARRIDALNSNGRDLSRSISEAEDKLRNRYQGPFELSAFLELEKLADVATAIAKATSKLNASRQASEILNREQPTKLPIPSVTTDAIEVLKAPIEVVAEEARRRVKAHLQDLDGRGESWLRQGLHYYASDQECPFCQQPVVDDSAIAAYSAFFSDAYRARVQRIQAAADAARRTLDSTVKTRLVEAALQNKTVVEKWRDLADLSYLSFETHDIAQAWAIAQARVEAAFEAKLRNPAEVPPETELAEAALVGLVSTLESIGDYNRSVERAIGEIADLKKAAATADQSNLEAELRFLRNTQIRHEAVTVELCEQLAQARARKVAVESERVEAKTALEGAASSLLAEHEAEINRLLECFGASFRIVETKPNFSGGAASSTYKISINDQSLSLGHEKTPRGRPCFRTALSAGDKSTLALAFFLAKLKREPDIGAKVVVFDDPLSSLDLFRLSHTQQELVRIARLAAQTLVLSHDPFFLRGVRESMPSRKDVTTLTLTRKGDGITIKPWDIDEYCLLQNHRDYFVLQRFLRDGLSPGMDLLTIARSIRPYVEGNLRFRYPDQFTEVKHLGGMIEAIRAEQTSTFAALKPVISEIEDLNEFSKKFHHDGPEAPPPPSEVELDSYARRAVKVVRG